MFYRPSTRTLVAALILLLPLSCTRQRAPATAAEGGLATQSLPQTGSVPADWGSMIAVTNNPIYGRGTFLWFQDEAGTVRFVHYDHSTNKLASVAHVVSRGLGGEGR